MGITYTQTDLDNLKTALVTGASEVQIGERRVRYRSQQEILQAIRIVQEYLEGTSSSSESTSVIVPTFSKGEKS